MPFISQEQIIDVKSKLTNDISFLGKLYRAKKINIKQKVLIILWLMKS